MASNPIKRRARQSFFLGFLIALVVMAVVVMLLFTRINKLNQENEQLRMVGPKVSVYTVNKDIEEGEAITAEDLQASTMQLSYGARAIDVQNYIDPSIFYEVDEETEEEYEVSYTAKVNIQYGTVVTLGMLQEGGVAKDERLMEYNMIVLPTQLKNGDYIDITLRLPNGKELIVLPKKRVEQCTVNSIWIKVGAMEISHMNSAIVDAASVTGCQLRATLYTDPLMQEANEMTYPVNDQVLDNIAKNPNILTSAVQELVQKWSTSNDGVKTDFRADRDLIDSYYNAENLGSVNSTDTAEIMDEAYSQEATDINTSRAEFYTNLEGTGLVGMTEE